MKTCKTLKNIKFSETENKENETGSLESDSLRTTSSSAFIQMSRSQIKIKAPVENFMEMEAEQIAEEYLKNPFFKRKLEYFLSKEKKFLKDRMPLEDFEGANMFTTESYYQKTKHYEKTDMEKMKKVVQLLNINLNSL